MSMFGKISDEELAAYLEGKLSKKKSAMVNAAIDQAEIFSLQLHIAVKKRLYKRRFAITLMI